MANIIDERLDEVELENDEELQSFDDSQNEQPDEGMELQEEQHQEVDDIPEKYRNKDIRDIVAMHQNAEQLLGKQGQEVGELRRVVDDFIKTQTAQNNAPAELQDFDEADFFADPKNAVEKLLNNHPSIKESQQLSIELKQQSILAKLKATHPDYMKIVQDANFAEWVGKSKIRTKLLREADTNYDFDAADELLTLWKERQGTLKTTVEAEKIQRKRQVKTASAGTSNGSGERSSRKIYRRADIIELMHTNPSRYEALMPEIRAAYAEGRVK
jgi:hypothetical protein